MPQGEVIIDPFSGQSLSREALDERLAPYRRRQGWVGDFDAPLGLFLQAASGRDVLARMLRNLKEIHRSAEDWMRLLAVQQRLVRAAARDLGGAARPRPGAGRAGRHVDGGSTTWAVSDPSSARPRCDRMRARSRSWRRPRGSAAPPATVGDRACIDSGPEPSG